MFVCFRFCYCTHHPVSYRSVCHSFTPSDWLIPYCCYVKQLATSCSKNSSFVWSAVFKYLVSFASDCALILRDVCLTEGEMAINLMAWNGVSVRARQIHSAQQPVYVTVQCPRGGGGGEERRESKKKGGAALYCPEESSACVWVKTGVIKVWSFYI